MKRSLMLIALLCAALAGALVWYGRATVEDDARTVAPPQRRSSTSALATTRHADANSSAKPAAAAHVSPVRARAAQAAATNDVAHSPTTTSPHATRNFPLRPIATAPRLPLAFYSPPDSAQRLTAEQQRQIEAIRENFIDQVGRDQDPNDPEYQKRWQAKQPSADELLRTALGWQNYGWWQLSQAQQKYADSGYTVFPDR